MPKDLVELFESMSDIDRTIFMLRHEKALMEKPWLNYKTPYPELDKFRYLVE